MAALNEESDMSHVSIESVGRRHYVRAPFQFKDQLRAAGLKWDPDHKSWWTGKLETAVALQEKLGAVAAAPAAPGSDRGASAALPDSTEVIGRATYKGRSYLLLWEGTTKRGDAAKLAFSDGSKEFWANAGEYTIAKRYQARTDWRTKREEYPTIGSLRRFKERAAKAKEQGYDDGKPDGTRYECPECGEYVTRGSGSCWETGAAH